MDKPNVLFIMTDQMRATASHLYGNAACRTPSLERLSTEGVRFEHAFTPHPLCVPARVSVMTSRFPHTHGARRNETFMPPGEQHAFRIWKESGYTTGLIGKNHCFERHEDLALFDIWCDITHRGIPPGSETRGMDWFRPVDAIDAAHSVRANMPRQTPRISYAVSDFPLEDYSTGLIAGQTVRFLERHGREPFALFVSFPDPHEPYEAPARYAAMFPSDEIDLPSWRDDEFDERAPERNRILHRIMGIERDPEEHVRRMIGIYYAMTRFVDDATGQILDALDRLGLRNDTIVVFCADHGDFMGEHSMVAKGGVFYDSLTRVPLIASWPGSLPQGAVDESMVNLVDILPTLLQLQGLDIPRAMQGEPLPTVTDAQPRSAVFSEYGAGGPPFLTRDLERLPEPYGYPTLIASLQWREAEGRRKMVRTRDWKYVHDPAGDIDELYDLASDPLEQTNVAASPAYREVVADLQRRLADWSISTEDPRPVPLPPTPAA